MTFFKLIRKDDCIIAKCIDDIFKVFFSKTKWVNFYVNPTWHNTCVKGTNVFLQTLKDHTNLIKEIIFTLLLSVMV